MRAVDQINEWIPWSNTICALLLYDQRVGMKLKIFNFLSRGNFRPNLKFYKIYSYLFFTWIFINFTLFHLLNILTTGTLPRTVCFLLTILVIMVTMTGPHPPDWLDWLQRVAPALTILYYCLSRPHRH